MGIPDEFGSVSRDGQRVVFAVPPMPTLQQITVLDRQGRVLHKVGEPGLYHFPSLSPDGTRVAVLRNDWQGDINIWTFDVASGQGIPLTNDASAKFYTPIWSPRHRGRCLPKEAWAWCLGVEIAENCTS